MALTESELYDALSFHGYPTGKAGDLLNEIQRRVWASEEPAGVQEKIDELRAELTAVLHFPEAGL